MQSDPWNINGADGTEKYIQAPQTTIDTIAMAIEANASCDGKNAEKAFKVLQLMEMVGNKNGPIIHLIYLFNLF